jgi:hypothetical protein
MADTGIFITTAWVQHYVPEWANKTTYSTEAFINIEDAYWETYICVVAGYDFVTNYASLHATMKLLLGQFVAMKAAMTIVAMDTSGAQMRTSELYFDKMTADVTRIENEIKQGVRLIKTGV